MGCIEILLMVWGVKILGSGRVNLFNKIEVTGMASKAIGIVLFAIFPVAVAVGIVVGAIQQFRDPNGEFDLALFLVLVGVDALLLFLGMATAATVFVCAPKRRITASQLAMQQDYQLGTHSDAYWKQQGGGWQRRTGSSTGSGSGAGKGWRDDLR